MGINNVVFTLKTNEVPVFIIAIASLILLYMQQKNKNDTPNKPHKA
jgi:hypothetical protein